MAENFRGKATRARDPFATAVLDVEDDAGSIGRELVRLAATEIEAGNLELAESYLQQRLRETPGDHRATAYQAVCMAMRAPGSQDAEQKAAQVVAQYPDDPIGYFALGRICLLASRRRDAFRLFARANRLAARERELRRQLERLDPRRDLVFRSLKRDHPLNLVFGSLRALFAHGRVR